MGIFFKDWGYVMTTGVLMRLGLCYENWGYDKRGYVMITGVMI